MKIAVSIVLLLAAAAARADTVQLADTTCINFVCFDPAPRVDYVSISPQNSVGVSLDGVLYSGGSVAVNGESLTAILYSASGGQTQLSASFHRWTTKVNNGRAHYTIQHLELLGGVITR